MATSDTYTLIKPFTAPVNASGFSMVTVTHTLQGIAWEVVQVGMSLAQAAPSPQVAAIVNGIPLVSAAIMVTSVFASSPGSAPVAMTSCFYGPPYVTLEAGDQMVVGVIGATPGDTFTVGAYINEVDSPSQAAANANIVAGGPIAGYVSRPRTGTSRWS